MSESKRVLIVGGVAGGASAAARARRLSEESQIVLFERGEHISFANCGLPYHIGGAIAQRDRLLVQTAAGMRKRFRIDVHTRTEVVSIDRPNRELVVRDLRGPQGGATRRESYDYLVLSPGAAPVRPPIPGGDHARVFTLRNMADMDAIKGVVDGLIQPGQGPGHAVIVGGGYIGLEMAEALRQRSMGVTLVERTDQVFAPADPEMAQAVAQELALHGVDVRLGESVAAIEAADQQAGVSASPLRARLSGGETVACDLLILAVGVKPEARLAQEAGLAIGPTGGILVDEHMRTSDERIYAVGDAVEVKDFVGGWAALIPLAGPANRQGRIAADNIFGLPSVYPRTQGTAICKVFDLAIGMTGLSEKACRRMGVPCEKVYVHPASHASYYPGASPLSLKVLFDPTSGKLLGAQAVGGKGVDKRIDVLAVALRAGMTVRDLQDLELSYAPPYGSAKDPINYAGFAASNALAGDVKLCHAADMTPSEHNLLLDVRTHAEAQGGTIAGAVNISVDELRDRLGELPRDKELLVFCAVGLRGYLACRMLTQKGFACRNLSGGYKTYRAVQDSQAARDKAATSAPAGGPPPNPSSGAGAANPATAQASCENAATSAAPGQCCCETKLAQDDIPKSVLAGSGPVRTIDATGLQCPGPILRLKQELATLSGGQALRIRVSDRAFGADVRAFCKSTGNTLVSVGPDGGVIQATIVRGLAPSTVPASQPTDAPSAPKTTLVVFSNDLDKALAAFIIANGAAAMGGEVTLFFTFWGLNILRKPQPPSVRKDLVSRMFGWMMPRGAARLTLSKMHMAGMGTGMMKGIMRKKNVLSLEQLIEQARQAGVRLVACTMSMDVMGIAREELLDGIEEGGVAMYLGEAQNGRVNLFI